MQTFQHAQNTRHVIPYEGYQRRLQRREQALVLSTHHILSEGIFSNGRRVAAFEAAFRDYLGTGNVVFMNSGSSALRAAYELLELPPGTRIIMPALSYIATAYACSDAFAVEPLTGRKVSGWGGLLPVFVDIDPETYTIDPAQTERAILEDREHTKVIVVVHLHGKVGHMRPILDLAERFGLIVIEDAAQAHGATYRDPVSGAIWMAGAIGHLGVFSFNEVKVMGSDGGDVGGLSITPKMLERMPDFGRNVRSWINHGRDDPRVRYQHHRYGIRARGREGAAQECLEELAQCLEEWLARRARNAALYTAALQDTPFSPPLSREGSRDAYFQYVVKTPSPAARTDLVGRLEEAGLRVGETYTVIADQPVYCERQLPSASGSLEVARDVSRRLVSLPCDPELTAQEVHAIVEVLASFRGKSYVCE